MSILAECPICRKKQALKNKRCTCGEDLVQAKKSKRVKYWINYRLPDGKQKRESVDSFTELNGYSIEDARKAESKRTVQRAEKRILDIKKEDRMTFNQLAEWYLGLEKVKNLASYWRIEMALNKFNSVFGNDLVSSIQPADLENYQARRKAEGLADATIDQEIGAAKSLIYKAFDNDMISGEILKKFKRIRKLLKAGSNKRDKVVSVQQAYELMENCNAFLKPIVATAYNTGMRRGEILNLKRSRLNMKEGLIQLRAEDTKNGRPRTIPITGELMNVLKAVPVSLHQEHVFLFKGNPVKDIRNSLKEACEKTGIPYGRTDTNGFVFHDIRHTVNTDMRRAGIQQSVIMSIMGHEDHSMFNRYNTVDLEDLKQAMQRLEDYRLGLLKTPAKMLTIVDQGGAK